MPTQECRCKACGHTFSRLFFLGDTSDKVRCPRCGEASVAKSPTAERLFKGLSANSTLAKDTN